jgi:hypothetical protein
MRDLELGAPEQGWLLASRAAQVNPVGSTWQANTAQRVHYS